MTARLRRMPLVCGMLLACVTAGTADELPVRTRRVNSAELRTQLGGGTFVPIERRDLEALLNRVRQTRKPRYAAGLTRVVYRCRVTEQRLIGDLDGEYAVSSTESLPLLPLGRVGFEQLQLSAPAGNVVWGTTPQGTSVAVLPDNDASRLTGSWELSGRNRPWGVEFEVPLLPAAASEILLHLPLDQQPVVNNGLVIPSARPAADGTRLWQIIPGTDSVVRIAVQPRRATESGAYVLTSANTSWSVSPEATRVRAEFSLQAVGTTVTSLTIPLPRRLRPETVTYGDEVQLRTSLRRTSTGSLLNIELPRPLEGTGQTIVVTGETEPRIGRLWRLPLLVPRSFDDMAGSEPTTRLRGATHQVRIASPLELRRLLLDGSRQIESVLELDGSQTISVEQVLTDATIALEIVEPAPGTLYHSVSRAGRESDGWATRTILRSDTALPEQIELRYPLGTDVVSVTAGSRELPCEFTLTPFDADESLLAVRIPGGDFRASFLDIETQLAGDRVPVPQPVESRGHQAYLIAGLDEEPAEPMAEATVTDIRTALPSDSPITAPDPVREKAWRSRDWEQASVRFRPLPAPTTPVTSEPEVAEARGDPTSGDGESQQLTLHLESRLSAGGTGFDTHRARVFVNTRLMDGLLRFHVTEGMTVTGVWVDDVRTRVTQRGRLCLVPLPPDRSSSRIELRYRTSKRSNGILQREARIGIPQLADVDQLAWTLIIPAGQRIESAIPFGTPRRSAGADWLARVLGPLAPPVRLPQPSRRSPHELAGRHRALLPVAGTTLVVQVVDEDVATALGWICLLASFLVTVLLGRFCASHRPAVLWVALTVVAAVLIPGYLARAAGGAMLGAIAAGLVLDIVRRGRPGLSSTDASGSTVAYFPSAVSAGIVLVCVVLAATRACASGQDRFLILETTDAAAAPTPRDMLYAEKALLTQAAQLLAAREEAGYLMTSSDYQIALSADSCSVTAVMNVVTLHPEQATIVTLPFAASNPGRCFVNGHETPVRRTGEPDELAIELGPTALALRALSATGEPTGLARPGEEPTAPEPATFRVEVELHPPVIDGSSVTFAIPEHHASSVRVTHQLDHLAINGRASADATAVLLGADALELRWGSGGPRALTTAEPELRNDCLIEVGPITTTYTHRIQVEPRGEPVRRIDLRIPAELLVESVRGDVELTHRVIPDGANNWCEVILRSPANRPFSLDLKLLKPDAAPLASKRVPLFPILPQTDAVETAAIVAVTGFEISGSDAAADSIPNLQEDFAHQLPAAGPAPLFLPLSNRTVNVEISELVAGREVWLDQKVHVAEDQLDCSISAGIRVRNRPVFDHELLVNSLLRIDSITVREDGVDRLARWHRVGRRLVLLLDGRTSGYQELMIRGRIPRQPDKPVPVPEFVFPGAAVQESVLTLTSAPQLEVQLENQDGIPFAVEPDPDATNSLSSTGVARYRIVPGSVLPLLKTSQRIPPVLASLTLVSPRDDGGVDVTTHYRIRPNSPAVDRVRFRVVTAPVPSLRAGTGVLQTGEDTASDTWALDFDPQLSECAFSMSYTLDPASGRWRLPEVEWLDGAWEEDALLVVPAEMADVVAAEARIVPPAAIPDWARVLLDSQEGVEPGRTFLGRQPWELEQEKPGDRDTVRLRIGLVETELWQNESRLAGRTTLFLDASAPRVLPLTLPRDTLVSRIRVNNDDMEVTQPVDQELVVDVPAGYSSIAINWEYRTAMPAFGSVKLDIPYPRHAVGQSLVSLHEYGQTVSIRSPDLIPVSAGNYAYRRFGALLSAPLETDEPLLPTSVAANIQDHLEGWLSQLRRLDDPQAAQLDGLRHRLAALRTVSDGSAPGRSALAAIPALESAEWMIHVPRQTSSGRLRFEINRVLPLRVAIACGLCLVLIAGRPLVRMVPARYRVITLLLGLAGLLYLSDPNMASRAACLVAVALAVWFTRPTVVARPAPPSTVAAIRQPPS